MPRTDSPLRYPGGKSQLLHFVQEIISFTIPEPIYYCEPFCGGAGVAVSLLLNDNVKKIILNDADFGIYSFWKAIINETRRFIYMINSTDITVQEWIKQKQIYEDFYNNHCDEEYSFDLGFSTFFLNRTNVSGIVKGGIIGGIEQNGVYKIDCRFNKQTLVNKINEISSKKHCVEVHNLDGREFLNKISQRKDADKIFAFIDPPYVSQGRNLYLNALDIDDHRNLQQMITSVQNLKWIVTYDDCEEIREMYKTQDLRRFSIRYSANRRRNASELMALSSHYSDFRSNTLKMESIL